MCKHKHVNRFGKKFSPIFLIFINFKNKQLMMMIIFMLILYKFD